MTDEVKMDRCEGGVVVLTLNRPSVLNAISLSLQQRLDELVGDVEADPSARCLVITGAGTRSFSAGYDVREMAAFSQDEMLLALLRREEMLWRLASLRFTAKAFGELVGGQAISKTPIGDNDAVVGAVLRAFAAESDTDHGGLLLRFG